ncbi:MAG: glycosyltransferase [Ruminococcaceae bacterium]|nr:glycosyltransferase [Oscillospiraceae bacterium]
MKVLHVISDSNIGGAGVLLCNLLTCFERDKVESTVALPCGSKLAPRLIRIGVPVLYLSESCERVSPNSVWELSRIIKKGKADLVHTNAAISARVAARLCGVPVLHTRHCYYPPTGLLAKPLACRVAGVCNRMLSDHVIATADAAAENLLQLGIPENKISIIINGSLPVREVDEATLNETRRAFGIQKEDFTVGICARLEECKGHNTFLSAAAILRQLRPDISFRFLMIGEGSRRSYLEQMTAALALEDCVTFTGFVLDMAPVYRILRVNVNCSCGTETSCLAISEGMSVGLPTVASDYGGNIAMIGESNAGILFPVGDAEALANAILQIAEDEELEKKMQKCAYERYLSHFTAEKMSREVQSVYENLTVNRRSRS